MPRPPKKPAPSRSASSREFAVVLETLHDNFRVYGEALEGFRAEVGARFDLVDGRFQQVDARLDGIDARLDCIDGDVALLKDAVLANTRELKNHGRQLGDLRDAMARKVDRDDLEA
jgi:hypothetical protein